MMNPAVSLVIAGGLAGLGFMVYQQAQAATSSADSGNAPYDPLTGLTDIFSPGTADPQPSPAPDTSGGIFSSIDAAVTDLGSTVSNFTTSAATALTNQNVQAFLMMIRTGEGTADAGGYTRLYGGAQFSGFADHPRQLVSAGGLTSTAAGAYQILSRTWDDLRKSNDLPDFSPANQDYAAVCLIKRRGALADVVAGRFDVAIAKCGKEWASLPGSPYGQPTITLARCYAVLAANGADLSGVQTA